MLQQATPASRSQIRCHQIRRRLRISAEQNLAALQNKAQTDNDRRLARYYQRLLALNEQDGARHD